MAASTRTAARTAARFVRKPFPGRAKCELLQPVGKTARILIDDVVLPRDVQRVYAKVVDLMPPMVIQPGHGLGLTFVNVGGFRFANVYVTSDPAAVSGLQGFALEVEFALQPTIAGLPIGGTSVFFNFDGYTGSDLEHRSTRCIADNWNPAGQAWTGASDIHILRVPVMGPYMRPLVFNLGTVARAAAVKAYLTT